MAASLKRILMKAETEIPDIAAAFSMSRLSSRRIRVANLSVSVFTRNLYVI
jgi:hypothetical protein